MLRALGSRSGRAVASTGKGFAAAVFTQSGRAESTGSCIAGLEGAAAASSQFCSTTATAFGSFDARSRASLLPLLPFSGVTARPCEAIDVLPQLMQARGFARLPFKLPSGEMPKKPPPKPPGADDDFANVHDDNKKTPQDMTNAMYMPWERRQFEGGELKWWEKAYWVLLILAVAGLGVKYMYDPMMNKGDNKINEEMEARMREEARAVLLGKSFLIDDDAFDGLSPKEIEEFVKKQTGASENDPFEGMTPEEINEYVKNSQAAK